MTLYDFMKLLIDRRENENYSWVPLSINDVKELFHKDSKLNKMKLSPADIDFLFKNAEKEYLVDLNPNNVEGNNQGFTITNNAKVWMNNKELEKRKLFGRTLELGLHS